MGGFARLRAGEVLSIIGKYPKAAGGGQRVHVSWPPPVPPLLSNSAPLASQGRARLALHPFPGGPLSPSAQLIPPPVRWRRLILEVMARGRCHKDTLLWVSCGEKRVTVVAPAVEKPGEVPLLAQGSRGTSLGDEGRRREYGGSVECPCLLAGGVMLQKENRYAETKDLFPCSLFRGMEPCYNVAAYPMADEPLPAPCRTSAHKGRQA